MHLKNKILDLLSSPDYIPLNRETITHKLKLNKTQARELKDVLRKLLEKGTLAKVKKDCYIIPKDANLISGTIYFKSNGSARLRPDPLPNTTPPESIEIRAEDTDIALHGDHVLIRVAQEKVKPRYSKGRRIPPPKKYETYGKVKRILQRASTTITGTLKKAKTYYYIIPDDPKIVVDIIVPEPKKSKFGLPPNIDDKVIVHLSEWTHKHLSPEGAIIRGLGPTHSPSAEFEALLHRYKLKPDFKEPVLEEVNRLPTQVSPDDIENRIDCRDLLTLTIDPEDAKDFDDALSLEKLSDNEFRVGIHIADVSAYVLPDTHLDKEAKHRGNSTYLVGTVIPMLPKALSNGICSLVENENRLTKAVFLTFNKQAEIQNIDFANTLICSNKRLTYQQAYAFLQESDLEKIVQTPLPPPHQTGSIGRPLKDLSKKELKDIKFTLRKLWSFASKMRKARMKKGSLDFDMPEVKVFVDASGKADRIDQIEYDESHQLIEEFMLAANEAVAKTLFDAKMAFISRVHDKPNAEKLNDLRETLALFQIHTSDLTKRKSVIRLLKQIKEHPLGYILKIHFLRSLKQACYRAEVDGHYGLYKTHYTHFTSPIRRYADLVLHRIFDAYLTKHSLDTAPGFKLKPYNRGELQTLAESLSATEQASTEAERESVKIKLLEFFEQEANKDDKDKSSFEAVIIDAKNHGIFVELTESLAFGLIHTSRIRDDIYHLNNEGTALVGRRRGRTFTVGQTIHVVVDKVSRFKQQMDFRLAKEEFSIPNYPSEKRRKGKPKKDQVKKIRSKTKQTKQRR